MAFKQSTLCKVAQTLGNRLANGQLHRQFCAAAQATASEHIAAIGCTHAIAEPMGAQSLTNFGLPGAFC